MRWLVRANLYYVPLIYLLALWMISGWTQVLENEPLSTQLNNTPKGTPT